jgi:hypothetical protein
METETGSAIWIAMAGNNAWSLGRCGWRVLVLDDQMHVVDRRAPAV